VVQIDLITQMKQYVAFGNASTSSRFFYKRTFDSINEALKVGKKIKPGMDDPAELLRVYTFALSKALTNKNLIHYLKNKILLLAKLLITTQ
jgi:hypothetical protein